MEVKNIIVAILTLALVVSFGSIVSATPEHEHQPEVVTEEVVTEPAKEPEVVADPVVEPIPAPDPNKGEENWGK